ncbi:MAG: response regulator transcription factor [Flavipsychrobacter sp.]|nr:response regulator transcription factor [Flavipsychrobacter sp.]
MTIQENMEVFPGKILVVDDEPDIVEFISYNLKSKGYLISTARDGVEAIRKARDFRPDLILLDIMMPNKDGIETIKELRKMHEFDETAIIFLTALNDEKREIEGLQIGADDYITKPIKPELLATRIGSALRRFRKDDEVDQKLVFGDLEINKTKFTVSYKGKEILLAKKEFELLSLLASKPGRVFLRNEILQRVWGTDVIVGDRTIDVHIRKIRQKIGIDLITTVKGVGYKFEMAYIA